MKTIKIYGASNDLIEVEGDCPGCGEYNVRMKGMLAGTVHIEDGTHHVRVHCIYDGSWGFAVCPQDGDYDVLPWVVSYSFGIDSTYSQTVKIEVPDNCTVGYGWYMSDFIESNVKDQRAAKEAGHGK